MGIVVIEGLRMTEPESVQVALNTATKWRTSALGWLTDMGECAEYWHCIKMAEGFERIADQLREGTGRSAIIRPTEDDRA